jgi:hypothetical protein
MRYHAWLSFIFLAATVQQGLAGEPLSVPVASTETNGAVLYKAMCFQCHGVNGEGNEQLKAPSIAGRPAWYVVRQLENFKLGRRGTDKQDVQGLLMAAVAKVLKPEQGAAVGQVIAKMNFVTPRASQALHNPNLEGGQVLFMERCAECHRFNATGEMTFGSPPLVGLQDWYLLAQLSKFKNGWRGADPTDPNGLKMQLSSQVIESDQAKHDVVAFILSLNATDPSTNHGDSKLDQLFGPAENQGKNEPQRAAR